MSKNRPLHLEYRDQNLVLCEGICPECNEPYEKMLLRGNAGKNKLCGKNSCKVSSQNKRSMRNYYNKRKQKC